MKNDSIKKDLILLAFAIGFTFLHAFYLMDMFNWFVTPIISGITGLGWKLGYWNAYGLTFIYLSLHFEVKVASQEEKDESFSDKFIRLFAGEIVLAMAYGASAIISLGVAK